MTPRTLFMQSESPCSKVASYQISMYSGQWFVKGIFYQITQNFTYCSLFLGLKRGQPLELHTF